MFQKAESYDLKDRKSSEPAYENSYRLGQSCKRLEQWTCAKGGDGLILCVYYVLMQEFILELAASNFWASDSK